MGRASFRYLALCLAIFSVLAVFPGMIARAQTIEIDAKEAAHPFPHFWEKMFGSGRAILSLRESYRHDLGETKRITGFEYVRFHAIFHDEAGFYDEDSAGKPVYNFSYVDQIYDGLLENHVRPFIELSFTPKKLASDPNALHAFWYKQNVSPPKDWGKWERLVENFTRHLVERYGVDEVAQWYFEVWNEPNIDFWAGDPKEATYYELGWTASLRIAKRRTSRWTLLQLTSTAMTRPRMSSARTNRFHEIKWSAAQSKKFTNRSPHPLSRIRPSSGASSTRAI